MTSRPFTHPGESFVDVNRYAEMPSSGIVTPSDISARGELDDALEDEKKEAQETDKEDGSKLERIPSRVSIADNTNAGLQLFFIVVAVSLTMFLSALDLTIVATAIPRITDEFKSLQDVGWYGSAFFLTIASFQSTWGKAYKYFPLKITFIHSIVIFEIGSVLCAVARNSTSFIVGRAIAGAGAAGITSGAYIIMAFAAPPGKAAAFTGIIGAVYAVASVVGPLLGGVLTDNLTWRWCFYINLPIGGVAAAIILAFFKAPSQAKTIQMPLKERILSLDPTGTFIFMAAMVCFLLFLQYGGVSHDWNSAVVIGLIIGFVLILTLFIAIQWKLEDRALLIPRLLKRKTNYLLAIFVFFNTGGFMILMYYLPIYFQVVSGVSAAQSGVRNVPFVLGISLFTIVSGVGITVTGHYLPFLILGAILTTIGNCLIYTLGVGSPSSQWIGYQVISGIGTGLCIQVPVIVVQATTEAADLSSSTSIMLFFRTLSSAIFVQIAQNLFTNKLIKVVPHNVPGLNPHLVVMTGATELRTAFQPSYLPGIIISYLDGLKDAYILAITLSGIASVLTVVILLFDRRKLKSKTTTPDAA